MGNEYPRALELPIDEDLSGFIQLLSQYGVPHRVVEENDKQVILTDNKTNSARIKDYYQQWRAGNIQPQQGYARQPSNRFKKPTFSIGHTIQAYPLTLLFLLFCIFGYLIVRLNLVSIAMGLTFQLPHTNALPLSEPWRFITPIFLHFTLLHIAFNGLWLWEIGHRIEQRCGHFFFFMLVIYCAAVSNFAQFWYMPKALFGGMSGVIYGLLGYVWIKELLVPDERFGLQKGIIVMMLIWLLLCMSGFVTALGFGSIANAAHLSGLISGALIGLLHGFMHRTSKN